MQLKKCAAPSVMLVALAAVAEPPAIQNRSDGLFGPSSVAQSPVDGRPRFEVASIKPNEHWIFSSPYSLDSDESFVSGQSLFQVDVPLTALIAFAYKLNSQ